MQCGTSVLMYQANLLPVTHQCTLPMVPILSSPTLSLQYILTLTWHLCLALPNDLYSSSFFPWTKLYMHLYSLPRVLYIPSNSSPLYTSWALQIMRLLIMQASPRYCTSSQTGPVLSLAPCFKSPESTFCYHCISHPCKTREMCNIMYCCSTYCICSDAMCGTVHVYFILLT